MDEKKNEQEQEQSIEYKNNETKKIYTLTFGVLTPTRDEAEKLYKEFGKFEFCKLKSGWKKESVETCLYLCYLKAVETAKEAAAASTTESKVIGLCTIASERDARSQLCSGIIPGACVEISSFCVDDRFKGTGTLFLDYVKEVLRDHHHKVLIAHSVPTARTFYTKNGFHIIDYIFDEDDSDSEMRKFFILDKAGAEYGDGELIVYAKRENLLDEKGLLEKLNIVADTRLNLEDDEPITTAYHTFYTTLARLMDIDNTELVTDYMENNIDGSPTDKDMISTLCDGRRIFYDVIEIYFIRKLLKDKIDKNNVNINNIFEITAHLNKNALLFNNFTKEEHGTERGKGKGKGKQSKKHKSAKKHAKEESKKKSKKHSNPTQTKQKKSKKKETKAKKEEKGKKEKQPK